MNTTHAALKSLVLVPIIALVAALAGCQQSVPVTGKVIQGDVSFIGVVDASDERLKTPGIRGADVAATTDPKAAAGAAVLGRATSDGQGNFRVSIADQSTLTRTTGFTARREGYAPASGVMPMPSEERRLLVILKPIAPAAATPAEPAPRGR